MYCTTFKNIFLKNACDLGHSNVQCSLYLLKLIEVIFITRQPYLNINHANKKPLHEIYMVNNWYYSLLARESGIKKVNIPSGIKNIFYKEFLFFFPDRMVIFFIKKDNSNLYQSCFV